MQNALSNIKRGINKKGFGPSYLPSCASQGGDRKEAASARAAARKHQKELAIPQTNGRIGLQHFAKRAKDFPTVVLERTEYAHVMSEIATNITKEQAQKRVFSKPIGEYIYTVENNGFGNYRIINKIKIEEEL